MPHLTDADICSMPRHGFSAYTEPQNCAIASGEYQHNHVQNIRVLNVTTGTYIAIHWQVFEEFVKPSEVRPAQDFPGRRLEGNPGYGMSCDVVAAWQIDITAHPNSAALYRAVQKVADCFPRDFEGGGAETTRAVRAFCAGEALDPDDTLPAYWTMDNPHHDTRDSAMMDMGFGKPRRVAYLPAAARTYRLCTIIHRYVEHMKAIGRQGRYPELEQQGFTLGYTNVAPRVIRHVA
jgi:hypothetical protein